MAQLPGRRGRAHRAVDAAVLHRLGALSYDTAGMRLREPASATAFWEASCVRDPAVVGVTGEWIHGRSRQLRIEGPSSGPGHHPGARRLIATAHVNLTPAPGAPMILIVHGYAVPVPVWDSVQAFRLRTRGAHTMLIDLPFHLRRRLPGRSSGDGFFGTDPARILAAVRQSVEDAAALVAWARREVSPTVAVMGVSLGGLVVSLLGAQVPLDCLVAVAPLCDPPATFFDHMPGNVAQRIGLNGSSGGVWGDDRQMARAMLDAALAPIVPRNLVPRTAAANMTLVRPEHDRIVGPQPITDLATTWGAEVWGYPYGHITVMNARGIGARIRGRLLEPPRAATIGSAPNAGRTLR